MMKLSTSNIKSFFNYFFLFFTTAPKPDQKVIGNTTLNWFVRIGTSVKGPFPSFTMRMWMQKAPVRFSKPLLISTKSSGPFCDLVDFFPDALLAFTFDPEIKSYSTIKKTWKYMIGSIPFDIAMIRYSEKMLSNDDDKRLYKGPKNYSLNSMIRMAILFRANDYLESIKHQDCLVRHHIVNFKKKSTNFYMKGQKKSINDMYIVDVRIREVMDNWNIIRAWNEDYIRWCEWMFTMSKKMEVNRISFADWKKEKGLSEIEIEIK